MRLRTDLQMSCLCWLQGPLCTIPPCIPSIPLMELSCRATIMRSILEQAYTIELNRIERTRAETTSKQDFLIGIDFRINDTSVSRVAKFPFLVNSRRYSGNLQKQNVEKVSLLPVLHP